jgi:hypothetical protein
MRWLRLFVALVVGAGCGSSSPWVEQTVPAQAFLTVYRVWVAGDDDVWLGGSSIWHFDGAGWTETPPPAATGISDFWGFSPTDVWAVGDAAVFHWDGTAWADVPATDGVVFESLYRVWGSSSTDLWIANTDNSRVYHFDGTAWTRTTLQFVAADALWGSSGSDIWLTGTFSTWHFDGVSWSAYQGIDDPRGAYGIWGFGANDVWAAGGGSSLAHWNGTAWTPEDDNFESYNDVWGSAPDDLYAVGDNGAASHYDGSSWSTGRELDVRENFTMVHGSSATNIWATGVDVAAQRAFVLRYQP